MDIVQSSRVFQPFTLNKSILALDAASHHHLIKREKESEK